MLMWNVALRLDVQQLFDYVSLNSTRSGVLFYDPSCWNEFRSEVMSIKSFMKFADPIDLEPTIISKGVNLPGRGFEMPHCH
jgi:hypothetical protein